MIIRYRNKRSVDHENGCNTSQVIYSKARAEILCYSSHMIKTQVTFIRILEIANADRSLRSGGESCDLPESSGSPAVYHRWLAAWKSGDLPISQWMRDKENTILSVI